MYGNLIYYCIGLMVETSQKVQPVQSPRLSLRVGTFGREQDGNCALDSRIIFCTAAHELVKGSPVGAGSYIRKVHES